MWSFLFKSKLKEVNERQHGSSGDREQDIRQRVEASYCTFDQFVEGLGKLKVYQHCAYHVHEAQAAYLFTADGAPGVNFVGRLEYFERDFPVILRRIDPSGKMLAWYTEQGFEISNDSGHSPYELYYWSEKMKEDVATFYAADLHLGYRFETRGEDRRVRVTGITRVNSNAHGTPNRHPIDMPVHMSLRTPSANGILHSFVLGLVVGVVYRVDVKVRCFDIPDLEPDWFQVHVGVDKGDAGLGLVVNLLPDVVGACLITASVFDDSVGLDHEQGLLTASEKLLQFPWSPNLVPATEEVQGSKRRGEGGEEKWGKGNKEDTHACTRGCRLVCVGDGLNCRQVCGFKGHCHNDTLH